MASNPRAVPSKFWIGGVNSQIHPADISDKQVAWAENVMIRGGLVQTRPGFKLWGSIPGGKLQGFHIYTPRGSGAILVAAVDGLIYQSGWPCIHFKKIEGLAFRPDVDLIHFCEALQSVKRNPDNTLEVMEPVHLLMIADGSSKTSYWDGTKAVEMDPSGPKFQTPVGSWMVWTSSRLWIGQGSQVRVSDLGNPTSFFDDQFLATRSYFELPSLVTGMVESANERGLLVFTSETTTAFQSSIRDRASWGATKDFQKLILPSIGCNAGRTACNQYGMTYWHSLGGIVSLDAALNTDRQSKLQTVDSEMMRSKRLLSPDMTRACAVAMDNLLLFSMPAGGKFNEHTWVLDQTPIEGQQGAAAAWVGIWTGIRPVQWAEGRVGGKQRLYCATHDRTPANGSYIHVWEALRDNRKDEGGRIACQVQFATLADAQSMSFRYAEFEVTEMLGDVTLRVYMMGMRGPWILLHTFEMQAEEGSLNYFKEFDYYTILRSYKPQSRTLRTPEFTDQGLSCSVESPGKRPNRDKGFALLFEWHGRMGIRDVRVTLDGDSTDSDFGKCEASETGEVNIVLDTGESP